MDFNAKYGDQELDCTSQPILLCDNNFPKMDFQHLAAYGSSSNSPDFGIMQLPQCNNINDPFDHTVSSYGSSTNNNNFNFYESKPFDDYISNIYSYGGGGGDGVEAEAYHDGNGGGGFFGHPSMMTVGGEIDIIGMDCRSNYLLYDNCHESVKPVNFVLPDEVSCTSSAVGQRNTGSGGYYKNVGMNNNSRTGRSKSALTRGICKSRKKSNVVKGQWTVEEDRLLVQLVEQYGVRKWSFIAQMLKGRIGKQCRERWHNHLRPNIKKDTWTEEEDRILIRAHEEIGNKWAEIAKRLPGRTENNIKNHWNATKRRQFSRRKCRSKFPRQSSLLQNYIKGLNLNTGSSTNSRKKANNFINSSSLATATTNDTNANATNLGNKGIIQPDQDQQQQQQQEHYGQLVVDEARDYCTDQLVEDFDFGDVPVFPFDASIMFDEQCSIDPLLDDDQMQVGAANCGTPALGGNIDNDDDNDDEDEDGDDDDEAAIAEDNEKSCFDEMEMMPLDQQEMESLMDCEAKKELDLVEMITQANQ